MAAAVGRVLFAFVLLLTLCSWPATSQDCGGQSQCGTAAHCPAGMSLVQDSCNCCIDCAKQLGELCTDP